MNKKNVEMKNTNKKGRTFTCGDIHGTHKALIQVLERSGFDYENDTLITLGDIVDGYGDSFKVVEELLKIKNRIDIIGNHDAWFLSFINNGIHDDSWAQGGLGTARSYAEAACIDFKVQCTSLSEFYSNVNRYMLNLNADDIPETHKRFFRRQIRYYKDEKNNLFVHGGIDRLSPLEESNNPFIYMWDRHLWSQALSANSGKNKLKFHDEFKNIFIGHTTTLMWGTDKPMKADIIWNLDTGAGSKGKLTIMDVDTHEYFQSDNTNELYPHDEHNKKFNK